MGQAEARLRKDRSSSGNEPAVSMVKERSKVQCPAERCNAMQCNLGSRDDEILVDNRQRIEENRSWKCGWKEQAAIRSMTSEEMDHLANADNRPLLEGRWEVPRNVCGHA